MIVAIITFIITLLVGAITFSMLSVQIKKRMPLLETFNRNKFAILNWYVFIPLFNAVAAYNGVFKHVNSERILISLMLSALIIVIIFMIRRELTKRNNWVRPKRGTTTQEGNYFFVVRFVEFAFVIYTMIGFWFLQSLWYPLLAIMIILLAQIANRNSIKFSKY